MKSWLLAAAALGFAAMGSPAEARSTIWDLKLGATIAEMPPITEFKSYACGSNGGQPLKQLHDWSEFAQCEPEPSGLYEVYFEYDDEDEYIARALEDIRLARDVGTVDKSFPIVASALFDKDGVLRGIRIVTDPRPEKQIDNEWAGLRPREEHHLLAAYLAGQFHIEPKSDCIRLPLGPEESPIGGTAVKQDCEKIDPAEGRRYVLQQRFFRKPGQRGIDPHTGALTQGQFESIARAEVYLLDAAVTPASSN